MNQTIRVLIAIIMEAQNDLDTPNSQAGKHLGQWASRRSAGRPGHVCVSVVLRSLQSLC